MKKLFARLLVWAMFMFLVLATPAYATTIGTNISTSGTLTVQSSSATSVLFQDAGGTNTLMTIDTTNMRVGVNSGVALDTRFEVGGTASAANLLTNGGLQVAGGVSVAYSRFGTSTTVHSNYIAGTNDLLISGDLAVVGTASFGGTASVSGIFFMVDGRHRPGANSTTAFRFQNAGGTLNAITIDTTNTRVGVGDYGVAIDTRLEVGGTASASNFLTTGGLQVAGGASVAYSRFGTSTAGHANISATNDLLLSGDLEVVGTASFTLGASISKGPFKVGTGNNATTSIIFDTISSTKGACLVFKNEVNGYTYLRVRNGSGSWSAVDCR